MKRRDVILTVFSMVVLLFLVHKSKGEVPEATSTGAQRVAVSEGNNMIPFTLRIGSQVVTDLYLAVYSTHTVYNFKAHRVTMIQNPLSNDIMVSTWINFAAADAWFFVPKDSGSFTTNNHARLFVRLGDGVSSGTIRGLIEEE